jgi:hypothetical protein
MFSLEGSITQRGSKLRVCLRLCRGSFVTDAIKETFNLATEPMAPAIRRLRELLPKEFSRDPNIQAAVLDPLEHIWAQRLRLLQR